MQFKDKKIRTRKNSVFRHISHSVKRKESRGRNYRSHSKCSNIFAHQQVFDDFYYNYFLYGRLRLNLIPCAPSKSKCKSVQLIINFTCIWLTWFEYLKISNILPCYLSCSSSFSLIRISDLLSWRKLFAPSKTEILQFFSISDQTMSVKRKISQYLTNAYSFPKPRSFVILNITTKIFGTLDLNLTYQLCLVSPMV